MSYELYLIPLAAAMALATAVLVRWAANARTGVRAAASLFLLGMMGGMLAGALYYYLNPGPTSLVGGLWIASALMSLSVVPVFVQVLREANERLATSPEDFTPRPFRPTLPFALAVVALVLVSELLMGLVFSLASGTSLSAMAQGSYGFASLLANVVQSPWFVFTMAAEMGLTVVLLRHELPRPLSVIFALQVPIMVLTPTALASAGWSATAVYVGSATMIVLFVFLFEYIYRHRNLNPALARYIVRLVAVYGLMMAGLFFWVAYGDSTLFALSLVLEMVLYFDAVLRWERFEGGDPFVWQLKANWAFALLASVFVAEIFMGALLDAQVFGSSFLSAIPALGLTGDPLTVLSNALYNGFFFLALVTASTWFLVMMGLEMGALVAFKFRETRSVETRVRLGLLMGCYGAFVVFFPSIYYSWLFPNAPAGTQVPVLGWSMGIGSTTIAPAVFIVILVTYAAMGSASALFGRRAICSTFCSAALMYQGTTVDSMKSFNRSSPLARKYLSSRFSWTYSTTIMVVMGSLVVASVYSVLDGLNVTNVTVVGLDPTVFLFTLYFAVLWYVMFVTIPYSGNYNCVTMGWCYTGAIAQAFQKIGFFKLKVKDRSICRDCTTLDCAKSCPVGLVDMPGHFRTKGEFRSTKCCGVGDCVEACPYGNMYIYDVRHAIARVFGRDLSGRPPSKLPMVHVSLSRPAPGPRVATGAMTSSAPASGPTLGPRTNPGTANR